MREEGEELLRRTCEGDSDWFRQGIFSRLTTGRDTLRRGNKDLKKGSEETLLKGLAPTRSCSALPLVGRRRAAPC